MKITYELINAKNIEDINKCNGEFIIDSKLVLRLDDNEISYTSIPVPATKKRYEIEAVEYSQYINKDDKAIILAYVDGQIAGQVILRKNWNKFAYIEDIAVDVQFRRLGIGTELISRAKQWAQAHKLPGIMLETQDNNVAACRFYESCGFRLRGFDSYLYKGIIPTTYEVALFWYLVFGDDSPG